MIRALILLITNLTRLMWSVMRKLIRTLTAPLRKPKRRYVALTIPKGIELSAPPRKIGPLSLPSRGQGAWWQFEDALQKIADDPEIEGVFFRAEKTAMGLAEVGVIADRLNELRKQGKRVICHMNQAMLPDYLLATAADTIMMAPPGRLYTFGLRTEMMFLGEALEKVGIRAQFINLGRYKTASHRFTRERMSRPQMIMMSQILEGMATSILGRVSERRDIPMEEARRLFDDAPLAARDARRHKLIDRALYADDIKDTIKDETECDRPVTVVGQARYLAQLPRPFRWQPLRRRRAHVAVLNLSGIIMMGNEGLQGQLRKSLTPKGVVKALKQLREDDLVKAVVLHIDSPGGSALASDLMWRAIRKLAEEKPVIASLGNVAASGGYYIAAAAHQIVAAEATITGSIGVIAGKLSGGELVEKLGVHFDSISVGETSSFASLTSAMSDTEVANLRRDIRAFYRRFLHRVSVGRNMDRRKVHRLARGRVYTAPRARTLGLVDVIGDLNTAIDLACKEASVKRDDINVAFVDHRQEALQSMLGRSRQAPDLFSEASRDDASSASSAWLAELLPEQLHPHVATALLMRQGAALTLWPYLEGPVRA